MKTINDVLIEFKEKPKLAETLPVLTLTERKGFILQSEKFNKRVAKEDTSSYKVISELDIAFNPYLLWAGAVAQNTIVCRGVISPLYPTFRVREGYDPGYISRLLLAPDLISAYDSIAYGSVPRRRRSSVADFLTLPLPSLPPLPEQRRIAAILDHADAIRTKRRKVLSQFDYLRRAVFREMFGEIRQSNWSRITLGELAPQIDSGKSPKCESRPANANETGVLKLSAVTYGEFRQNENKAFLGASESMTVNEVHAGDVLMTRKNTRELVGAVALVEAVRPNLLMPDLIFRLHLDESRLNRYYFQSLMMNPDKRNEVRDLSSGSASSMPNISKARLAKLPLEIPPLTLQQTFADRIQHLNTQRLAVERALAADNELFASLQSRAFRGEL